MNSLQAYQVSGAESEGRAPRLRCVRDRRTSSRNCYSHSGFAKTLNLVDQLCFQHADWSLLQDHRASRWRAVEQSAAQAIGQHSAARPIRSLGEKGGLWEGVSVGVVVVVVVAGGTGGEAIDLGRSLEGESE